MKNILTVFILFLSLIFFSAEVSAQFGQYGPPPPSFSILMNKLVSMPAAAGTDASHVSFVDNLSQTDPKFSPGQDIFFKLIVKNTSSTSLTNVTVKDYIPSYLEPLEGPGSFDSSSRILSFNAGDFSVNEEKTYFIKMRVLDQNQLPSDKGLFCLVNRSRAENANTASEDTAQFCIEKQVSAVPKVPSAGPEMGLVLMSVEVLTLGAGLIISKISHKKVL